MIAYLHGIIHNYSPADPVLLAKFGEEGILTPWLNMVSGRLMTLESES